MKRTILATALAALFAAYAPAQFLPAGNGNGNAYGKGSHNRNSQGNGQSNGQGTMQQQKKQQRSGGGVCDNTGPKTPQRSGQPSRGGRR